jgi:mannonate dehydratase
MRILRDVQYPYMILPDHNPTHPDDCGKPQAYAGVAISRH